MTLVGAYSKPSSRRATVSASAALEALETILWGTDPDGNPSRRFRVQRIYYSSWDPSSSTDAVVADAISKGRMPLISVKPPGGVWGQVSSQTSPDTTADTWATKVIAWGVPLYFCYHHEPMDEASAPWGSGAAGAPDQYVADWQYIVSRFRALGATNAIFVPIFTQNTFVKAAPTGYTGVMADWFWPGDSWVDRVGVDGYNFNPCGLSGGHAPANWTSFYARFNPVVKWAVNGHPGKRLIVAEFGCMEQDSWDELAQVYECRADAETFLGTLADDGDANATAIKQAKGSWFDDVVTNLVTSPPGNWANLFEAICYFDSDSQFFWWLDTRAYSLARFQALVTQIEAATAPAQYNPLTAAGSTTAAASYQTASISPTPGRVVIVDVENSKASAPDTPSISGNSITWTPLDTVVFAATQAEQRRLTRFVGIASSPTPGQITISFGAFSQSGCAWAVTEFSGLDLSAPVRNTVHAVADSAPASSLQVTLPSFGSVRNSVYAAAGQNNNNGFAPGDGFVPVQATTYTTPNTTLFTQFRTDPDMSVDVFVADATSWRLAIIASELVAAPVPPKITAITPTAGAIGRQVTITGTDLTGVTSVKFNGISAAYTVDSPSQITATVPAGATTGRVTVTTAGGTATSDGDFVVTVSALQPTVVTASGDPTDRTSYQTASVTLAPNKLYLLAVHAAFSLTPVPTPTVTGCGMTWVQDPTATLEYQTSGTVRRRLTVFRALSTTSPTPGQITISFGAFSMLGCEWELIEIPGVPTSGTNGSDALRQWAPARGVAGTITASLAPLASPASLVMAFAAENNTVDLVAGPGLLELTQVSQAQPVMVLTAEWGLGQTDLSISTASGVQAMGLIAIEVVPGLITAQPAAIVSTETFGLPTVLLQPLAQPEFMPSTETFGLPTVLSVPASLAAERATVAPPLETVSLIPGGAELDDWTATDTADGGLDTLSAVAAQEDLSTVPMGGFVGLVRSTGAVLWRGQIGSRPEAVRGKVHVRANGLREAAGRSAGRLLYQTRDYSLWSDAGADPYGYAQSQHVSVTIDPGAIIFDAVAPLGGSSGFSGAVLWCPAIPLTRMAFTITIVGGPLHWWVEVDKAVGPSGSLQIVQTYQDLPLVGGSTSVDLAIPQAAVSPWDLIKLSFKAQGYNSGADERYRCVITNLRVNSIASGDVFTSGQLFIDVGSRLGYDVSRVEPGGANVLPLDWTGPRSGLLQWACLIQDARWYVDARGRLDVGPWGHGGRIFQTVLTGDEDLDPVLPYNQVRIAYQLTSGVPSEYRRRASPDPLASAGITNEWYEELADPQPDDHLPRAMAVSLLAALSRERVRGRLPIDELYFQGRAVHPWDLRAGDLLQLIGADPPLPPQRVVATTKGPRSPLTVAEVEQVVSSDRLLANLALQQARGHPLTVSELRRRWVRPLH